MASARIIAVMNPFMQMSAEHFIAYCARVSNPENQTNEEYKQLLRYLIRHNHWSPFEMVGAVVELKTTRDIGREILRHRSFSFQEFSQRYARATTNTVREVRLQDTVNRQNSLETDDVALDKWWKDAQQNAAGYTQYLYENALRKGIAKEVARAILPEGMTDTTIYMNGTLRSWIHYLQVRLDETTQKEHRELAHKIKNELRLVFPTVMTELFGE